MKLRLLLVPLFLFGCFEEKEKENPTNCSVAEVPDGVEFHCTDKNGVETSGVVKHGEQGAKGEQGQAGEAGKQGPGLKVAVAVSCKGTIEAWMEKSAYEIDFHSTEFETGDTFLSELTTLKRDGQVVSMRQASAFYLKGGSLALNDGLFSFSYGDKSLKVKSQGGIDVTIPCEVSK